MVSCIHSSGRKYLARRFKKGITIIFIYFFNNVEYSYELVIPVLVVLQRKKSKRIDNIRTQQLLLATAALK